MAEEQTVGAGAQPVVAPDADHTIVGTSRSDVLSGGDGADVIEAGAGNDIVFGGRGNDTLLGADGRDKIISGDGADSIDGGAGDDSIDGGAASDRIDGGDGSDTIFGGSAADTIFGGAGDDILSGDDGNDQLSGGTGSDILRGGGGNDNFVVQTADQRPGDTDTLEGGAGIDTLEIVFVDAVERAAFEGLRASEGDAVAFASIGLVVNGIETVNGVVLGDGPSVSGPLNVTLSEDDPATQIDLTAGAVDPAGGGLTVENLQILGDNFNNLPVQGAFLQVDTGFFQFLAAGTDQRITVNFDLRDIAGERVSQTLDLTITGENDAPEILLGASLVDLDIFANILLPGPFGFIDFEDFAVGTVEPITDGFATITSALGNQSVRPQGFTQIPGVFEGQFFGFSATDFFIDFASDVSAVTFGLFDPNTAGGTVRALDRSGGVIQELVFGTDVPLGPPGGSTSQPIVFVSPNSDIARVEVSPLSSDLTAIDQLGYGTFPTFGSTAIVSFSDPDLGDAHRVDLLSIELQDPTGLLPTDQAFAESLITDVRLVEPGAGGVPGRVEVDLQADNTFFEGLGSDDLVILSAIVQITDSAGASVQQTVNFNLTGVNDTPIATPDAGETDENTPRIVDVLANDVDLEGDQLSVVRVDGQDITAGPVTLTSGAEVRLNQAGQLVYDPRGSTTIQALGNGDVLPEVFEYTVADEGGAEATGVVVLTVNGVDENPSIPLNLLNSFDPAESGSLYGAAVSPDGQQYAVITQSSATIEIYDVEGQLLRQIPLPGDNGNDGDLFFADAAFELNGISVPAGSLLVMSGDVGTAEIFAIPPASSLIGDQIRIEGRFPDSTTPNGGGDTTVLDGPDDAVTIGGTDNDADGDRLFVTANRDITFANGRGADAANIIRFEGLDFSDGATITGVEIRSSFGQFDASRIAFGDDFVTVDVQGLTAVDGDVIELQLRTTAEEPIVQLSTDFGANHVVGADFSAARGTLFLLSCNCETPGNEVAEVDPTTGAVLNRFSLDPLGFQVFFGDLAVDPVTGDLFIVSDQETQILRITPEGGEIERFDLPSGVSGLSGIDIPVSGADNIVLSSTNGSVFELGPPGLNINEAPTVTPITVTANEDQRAVSLPILTAPSAVDPDNDPLSALNLLQTGGRPVEASILNDALQINFEQFNDLSAGESQTVNFTFDVSDGVNAPVGNTIEIVVEGRNDAVTANDDGSGPQAGFVTTEGNALSIAASALLANDVDPDANDVLTITDVDATSTEGASVSLVRGSVVYDPNGVFDFLEDGQTLTDTFTYTVSDGNGSTDTATVTVSVTGVTGNQPPNVSTIRVTTNEDAGVEVFDLLASPEVSDPDNDQLTVSNLNQLGGTILLSNAAAEIVGSTLEFDTSEFNELSANEEDLSEFAYDVSDDEFTVRNTIEITVEGRNDAAQFNNIGFGNTVLADTARVFRNLDVNVSDPDANDVISVINLIQTQGTSIEFDLVGNRLDFFVDDNFVGLSAGEVEVVEFTFDIFDGTLAQQRTIQIGIEGVNDPLQAFADDLATDEDTALVIGASALTENDFDPDGDDLLVQVVNSVSASGATISFDGDQITYDPRGLFDDLAVGETATDTFSYTVTDQNGASDTATVTVTIDGVNDAPQNLRLGEPETQLVSVNQGGTAPGSSGALQVIRVSADGNSVLFASFANDLVPGDANSREDLFVRDLTTGVTERVSVRDGTGDNESSGGISQTSFDISGDGNVVVFASQDTNLDPDAGAAGVQVYARNRADGTTQLVSVGFDGTTANSLSFEPSISDDGRFVAFISDANNLVEGLTGFGREVYVRDLQNGTTQIATLDANGNRVNSGITEAPVISGDGTVVAFRTTKNLVPEDTNSFGDIYIRDLDSGVTERVSVATGNLQLNDGAGAISAISADGRFIAFQTAATNLGVEDFNQQTDIFVHDRDTGVTELVSRGLDGNAAFGGSTTAAISADGRFITFTSNAANIVAGDDNGATDLFRLDRDTGEIVAVNTGANGLPAGGAGLGAISGDGATVAFSSSGNGNSLLDPRVTGTSTEVFVSAPGDRIVLPDLLEPGDSSNSFFDLLSGFEDPEGGALIGELLSITSTNDQRSFDEGTIDADGILDVENNSFQDIAAGKRETITFTFSVIDDQGDSIVAQAFMDLVGVNDAPEVFQTARVTTDEDAGIFTVDLSGVARDEDGDDITLQNLNLVTGQRTLFAEFFEDDVTANNLPDNGFLPVEAGDGSLGQFNVIAGNVDLLNNRGGSDGGAIDLDGSAPTGSDDPAGVIETAASFDLRAGFVYQLIFTLEGNAAGSAPDTITVDLGSGVSETIVVQPTDDRQTFRFDFTPLEDETAPLRFTQQGANDTNGAILDNITLTEGPVVALDGDQAVLDTNQLNELAEGEERVLVFTFDASDGVAADQGLLEITVAGRNDAPILGVETLTAATSENAGLFTVDLAPNVTDPDLADFVQFTDLVLTSPANTIFAEDFEDEVANEGLDTNSGSPNFTGFNQFVVTDGTVDLLNQQDGGTGAELDLDGTGTAGADDPAGRIETQNEITFRAGFDYTLSFDLRGNAVVAGDNDVQIQIGALLDQTVTIPFNAAEETFTFSFSVATDQSADLSFTQLGVNDLGGALLSDVVITESVSALIDSDGLVTIDPGVFADDLAVGESEVLTFDYTATDGIESITGGLEITINGANDPLAAVNDLPTESRATGFFLNGNVSGDRAGYAFTDLGDVNGDGFTDLAVSAPNGTPGSFPNAGYSYIVFGGPDIDQFSSLDLQSLDGSNGFRFDGFSGGLYAGTSLANAGDVNGDGLDDILIGARENYYGEAGRSFVVFGAANLGSGGIIELDEFNFVDGVNAFQIVADNAISPGFLNQVQSVGDLNDDGFDDVAVSFQGAEFPDGESGRETATTYIIFGTDQAVDGGTLNLSDIDGSNGFFVQAPDGPYTSFAYSMTAGDINGDGIDDLIIGDDTASGSSGYGGAVFVILGATDLGPAGGGAAAEFELGNFDFGNLDGSNGFAITPAEDGEGLGRGVSAIGDINGDGLDDLVLSSYRGFFDNTQDNYVGRVQVVFGATDLGSTSGGTFGLANYSAQTLNMISLNERFLGKVDILGDVNGDGFDDLLISVASGEFATDTAFLVFGSETLAGQTINLDTLDGTDGYRLAAPTTSNNLARGAGAGDLNNDGLADLVFGDPGFDDGQRFNVGQAAVVFGGATSLAVLDALDGTTNGLIDLGLLGGFLAGSLTTDEDTVLSFVGADLLANDFDPSGNPISIQSVDTVSAAGASVAFDGTTVSYDPGVLFQGLSLGESATDTFTYTITAGGQTATATATVQIDGANDAPSAPATLALQAHRTDRDDVLGPQPGDVTDPDQNDALIFTAELGDGVPLPSLLEGAFSTTDGTFSLGVGVGDGGDEGLYRIESTVTDGATTPLDFGYYIAIHDVDTVGSVGGENLVTSGDGVVSDLIFGGGGRDRLQGGNGADIYVYRSGDDADVVDDDGFSGQDAVLFEDYSLADAIFARFLRDQNELLIDLPDADSLRIVDALGDSGADVIESYAFSDGATISVATLRQLLLDEERTAGKDRLIGFDGANALTLEGDLGDDLLSGRNGSDTYLYTLGDGSDLISEGGFRDTDVVEISGTTLEATALKRGAFASNDLVIQFSDGGEIRIVNTLNGSQTDQVEQVVFAEEAATLGAQDLRDILIEQVQSAGDDAVIGFNQIDDTLQGGAGDDFLSGLSASDLYLYNASGATDGNDTIFDNGFAGTDVLQIDGIESTSLAFRRLFNTDDLLVDITDGSGGILSTITIVDAIDGNENDEIEEIVTTNDQTTLTAAGIRDILIDGEESAGQTTITGFSISADTILANGGERVLTGFNQGDTYQVDSSSDDVVIVDDGFAGTDRLELLFIDDPVRAFRAQGDLDDLFIDTNNQIIRIVDGLEGNNGATIEVVQEGALGDVTIADLRARLVQETNTAGDDRIIGTTFSDTIDLDIGTDFIDLRSGVDSLTYSAETGDKIVTTALQAGSNGDTLTFADFATTEVDIHVSAFAANAVSFDFDFGIGEVTLVNGRDARAFEVIVFVDQTFTGAEIGAAIDAAATPIDLITGDNDANTLTAGAPAEDRVALQGLGGNDLYEIVVDPTGGTVSASFVEIFEGGVGDDVLSIIGTDASGVSFGRVQSDLDGASNLDVLDEGDLLITTGVGEVLVHQAFQGNNTIETFRFTNTVEGLASVDLTLAEVQEIIIGNEFTLGDDTILGFNGADTIATQAGGSDVLRGLNGADLYQITDNAENFVVIDDAGGGDADVVEFQGSSLAESAFSRVNGDRDDLLVTDSFDREILIRDTLDDNFNGGIATLRFDGADVTMADVRTLLLAADETSGSDTIIGFRTADTISVASGDDVLNGRDGADVYEIDGAGFGDVLIDDQGGGDADTVVILNTARSSASFARDPVRQDTLLIRLDGGKTITIRDTLSDNFSGGIASITFDNAGNVQTLTMLDIRSELLNGLATEGDDQIVGFSTDDTLDGGTGNDALRGGDGSDVYIFGLDSGRDRIDDNGSFDTDVLDIGVSFAQIQLSRGGVTGEDIILDIADTDDRVTVVEGFRDGQNNGIEEFQFTDQTLTTLDLRALLLAGETSAGADTIVGFGGADTLIGGAGNDQLLGEGGDDLYIFRVGDGADIINDTPTNGSNNDRIDFDGFTLADASFSLLTPTQNHILVELSSGDQVTVIEGSGANGRIETYEFDDQTLTLAEVEALL